jgi:VWFA-related protein
MANTTQEDTVRRVLFVFGIVAAAYGLIGQAQQAPAPALAPELSQNPLATFRADANFVEIDAVVTDERGNPVKDLSQSDFEIFEDGKRQVPSVFALVDLPLTRPAGSSATAEIESDVRSTTRRFDGRLYVLVLDDLHTTTTRTPVVRSAAKKFIQEYLTAGDFAAVVNTSGRLDGAQELTPSRRLLLQAIDRFMGQKLPSAASEKLAAHLLDSTSQPDSSDSASNNLQRQDPIADPLEAERAMNARRMFDLVRNLATWMTDIQGRRKALLLFSEGIDYDIYDVFNNRSASTLLDNARETIAAAQRANVSIYAVDPRGLTGAGDDMLASASASADPQIPEIGPGAFGRELLLSQESLIAMAEETGGTAAVRTNDIAGALARIARENSTYYLLGYHSDSDRKPGRFRKIDVRVTRPGLRVRARRGYMAPDPKKATKAREAPAAGGVSSALRAALSNPLPIGDLPLRVVAVPFKGVGRNASVLMALEISGASLRFEERGGTFQDKLELSIAAVDYQGKTVDPKLQAFNLNLPPDLHAVTAKGGLRILSRLNLPPSRYQIRVGVHDTAGGGVATLPYDIEVPDYTKATFALSGLVLASSRTGGILTMKPDPELKEVLPLPPTAVRRFLPDETIAVVAQIYDDSSRLAHTVDVHTTIRRTADDQIVFDKRDERALNGGATAGAEWFKADIPLKQLAPGKYILTVQATSRASSSQVAVQQVPFEIGS